MIYADANILIRLLEGNVATRGPIEGRLLPLRGTTPFLLTSRLSRLECRTKPLRNADVRLLTLWDDFFATPELAPLVELTPAMIEKATELRASLNMKTPDAIHFASAIVANAAILLTGDRGFCRCRKITVEIL